MTSLLSACSLCVLSVSLTDDPASLADDPVSLAEDLVSLVP